MQTPDYYRSEKFIWDNLKVSAAGALTSLYTAWRSDGKIDPFAVSWPSEVVLDDLGLPLKGTCLLELPKDKQLWTETLKKFVSRTKAYALLITEQRKEEILVILESQHGTRSWSIPIQVSGDLRALGTAVIKDDHHKIGILWKPRKKLQPRG